MEGNGRWDAEKTGARSMDVKMEVETNEII